MAYLSEDRDLPVEERTLHFAYPFERGADGKPNTVEQDTPEHVMSCVELVVRCPAGFRQDRPEFGYATPEFRPIPLDTSELEGTIRKFEPRVSSLASHEQAELYDLSERIIETEVRS